MARIPLSDPVIQNLIAEKQIERRQREIANSLNPIQGSGLGAVNISDLGIFNNPGISQNVFDKAVERGKEKEKTGLGQLIEGFQRFISPDMTPQQTLLALAGPKTEGALLENLFSTGLGTFTTASDSEETRPQILKGIGPDIAIDEFNFPDEITEQLNNMRSSETNQTNQTNQKPLTDEGIQPDEAIDNVGRGDAREITSEDKKKLQENLNTDKKSDPLEEAFSEAMQAYNEALTGEVSKDSIEKYKKQFAEATGIDVSGKVDNRTALQAFGLALMQNKAGKDFNVSKILSEVGKAGEAAQPALEQARKEARAGEISAGKFGLEQAIADRTSKIAAAQKNVDAIRERIAKLEERAYDKQTQIEIENLKTEATLNQERIKQEGLNAREEIKASAAAGELSEPKKITLSGSGDDKLEITVQQRGKTGEFDILAPQAAMNGVDLKIKGADAGLKTVALMKDLSSEGQTVGMQGIYTRLTDALKGLGSVPVTSEGSNVEQYRAAVGKMLVRYRKLLTGGEAGNAISDRDVAIIRQNLGLPEGATEVAFTSAAQIQEYLDELSDLFQARKDLFVGQKSALVEFGRGSGYYLDEQKDTDYTDDYLDYTPEIVGGKLRLRLS